MNDSLEKIGHLTLIRQVGYLLLHAVQHLPLGSAQIGDLIKIETTYGTYTYKITETVVKKATDPTAYDPTKTDNSIVLYTCYPFNTIISVDERYFVYADFVSGPILIKE